MNECEACKNTDEKRLIEVTVVFHYQNPKAVSYPEIAYWEKKYTTNICPMCGRKYKEVTK